MTDEFRAWLRDHYGLRSPFMLQPSVQHGKYRYRFDFRRAFNSHMKGLGLEEFTFHDLRRTFASLLVSRGVSIYKVAKWLGDEIKTAESTYGHLVPQDDEINSAWTPLKGRNRGSQNKASCRPDHQPPAAASRDSPPLIPTHASASSRAQIAAVGIVAQRALSHLVMPCLFKRWPAASQRGEGVKLVERSRERQPVS